MSILLNVLLIIAGLAILVKGADIFVEGSSRIAKKLNVSELLIGLTLVAFGTSFPELSISVIAALSGSDGLAIGNVVGSNIYNVCFILGVLAFIRPIAISKSLIKKDMLMKVLTSFVLFILLFDYIFTESEVSELTRSDGLIFLLFFLIFLYYTFYSHLHGTENTEIELKNIEIKSEENIKSSDVENEKLENKDVENENAEAEKEYSLFKNIIMILVGLAGVLLGGEFVVSGSISVAGTIGISDTLIGLTVVSIGTSLPELVTGIVAMGKNKDDMAVGNIVGSSVFNVLFILGVTATISPITLTMNILVDVIVLMASSVLLFFLARSNEKITKIEGLILLIMYVGYFIYIIYRG